jgi:hypothetical protein
MAMLSQGISSALAPCDDGGMDGIERKERAHLQEPDGGVFLHHGQLK